MSISDMQHPVGLKSEMEAIYPRGRGKRFGSKF